VTETTNLREIITHLINGWVLIQNCNNNDTNRWVLINDSSFNFINNKNSIGGSWVKDVSHLSNILENLDDPNSKRLFINCYSSFMGNHKIKYTPIRDKLKAINREDKLNEILTK
jgi:hypothetical protein